MVLLLLGDSLRCVQVNFRKVLENFKDCIRKEVLFRYMRKRGYFDHNNVPKECILIKAGIRGRKPGCDCIWEMTRQQDLALLEEMFRLLDDRKAHRNYFFKKLSFCFFCINL